MLKRILMLAMTVLVLVEILIGTTAAQDQCTSRVESLTLNTVDGYQEIPVLVMGDSRLDPVEQTVDITAEATANTASNVRVLPKRDAQVLVSLPAGTTVTAVGKVAFADGDTWIQVKLPDGDRLGWVYQPLLDNPSGYDNVLPFNPDTLKPYYIIPSAYILSQSTESCGGVVLQNPLNVPARITINTLGIEWTGTLYLERDTANLSVSVLQGAGEAFAPNQSTPIALIPGASLSTVISPQAVVQSAKPLAPLAVPETPLALDSLPVKVEMPQPLTLDAIERLTTPNHQRIPRNFSASYTCEVREVQAPAWSMDSGEVTTLTTFSGCNTDNRFLFQLSRTFTNMQYQLISASEDEILIGATGDIGTISLDPHTLQIRPGGYINSSLYSILVPLTFPVIPVPQLHPSNPPAFTLIPSYAGGSVVYTGGYTQNVQSKYEVEVTHTYTFNAFSGLLTRLEYQEWMTACYFCVPSIGNRVPFQLVHLVWNLDSTTMPMSAPDVETPDTPTPIPTQAPTVRPAVTTAPIVTPTPAVTATPTPDVRALFTDDFSDGDLSGWDTTFAADAVEIAMLDGNATLHITGKHTDYLSLGLTDTALFDGARELEARILFRSLGDGEGMMNFNLMSENPGHDSGYSALVTYNGAFLADRDGGFEALEPYHETRFRIPSGRWHTIRLALKGNSLNLMINGESVRMARVEPRDTGVPVFIFDRGMEIYLDDVVIRR